MKNLKKNMLREERNAKYHDSYPLKRNPTIS